MTGGLFITGTDTGVGKTSVCCHLVRGFRKMGLDAVGMKPFACGDREDAVALDSANGGCADLGLVNPVWLRVPAAPYTASLVENRVLDVSTAWDACRVLREKHRLVLVEGVGGWRVPLTDQMCMSDFAVELGFPVVVVVANRLGALNHARLTVDAIQQRGLSVAAILWNDVLGGQPDTARVTNQGVFEQWKPGEFHAEVEFGATGLSDELLEAILRRIGQDESRSS